MRADGAGAACGRALGLEFGWARVPLSVAAGDAFGCIACRLR